MEDGRQGRESSSQFVLCHYLFVKVGVLYLLVSVCSCLFHAYAIGIVICVPVCMLGMLGRIETMFLKCFPFMFLFEFQSFLVWVFWHYSPLDRAEVGNFGKGPFSWTPTV